MHNIAGNARHVCSKTARTDCVLRCRDSGCCLLQIRTFTSLADYVRTRTRGPEDLRRLILSCGGRCQRAASRVSVPRDTDAA